MDLNEELLDFEPSEEEEGAMAMTDAVQKVKEPVEVR